MSKSVAVCVKKGHSKLANEALQWLEKETELPAVRIYLPVTVKCAFSYSAAN